MEKFLQYLRSNVNYISLGSYIPKIFTAALTYIPAIIVVSTTIYYRNEIKSIFSNIFSSLIGKPQEPLKSKVNVLNKDIADEGVFFNNSQGKNPQNFIELREVHDHQSKLLSGKNTGKKILRKIPVNPKDKENPNKAKFKFQWIAKQQTDQESINEIISADAFRLLVGNNFSPKYRLVKDDKGQTWTVTKILKDFKQMGDVLIQAYEKTRDKQIEDFIPAIPITNMDFKKYKEAYLKTCLETDPYNYYHRSRYLEYLNLPSSEDRESQDIAIEIYNQISNMIGSAHSHHIKNYNNLTSKTENFHQIIATALMFGKDDMHQGNWGIIQKDDKQYVATVDHGQALKKRFSMYLMMYQYQHSKEKIVTTEFAEACINVAKDFDKRKSQIKAMLITGINRAKEFYPESKIADIQTYMDILEFNKQDLIELANQIQVEIAIYEGNPAKLKEYLNKMKPEYFVLDENGEPKNIVTSLSGEIYQHGYESVYCSFVSMIMIKLRLENDCNKNSEGHYRSYQNKMTDQDRKVEEELLKVYYEVARSKNYYQAKINDERNQGGYGPKSSDDIVSNDCNSFKNR